jgi:subtilisin family serine protease
MGYLVLTIPKSDEVKNAVTHMEHNGESLGVRYVYSLSQMLERGGLTRSADRIRELPHNFHLLQVLRPGDDRVVLNRVLRLLSESFMLQAVGERNETLMLSVPYLGIPFIPGGKHTDGSYPQLMKVGDAHHDGVKGSDVRIAIADSGLDNAAGLTVKDYYDVQVNPIHAGLSRMKDSDGHGTAMATLVRDVAPAADIYIVRCMDQGSLELWNLLAGVGVAAFDCEAHVISLSCGFDSFLVCTACGATGNARSVAFEKLLEGITQSPYLSNKRKPVYVAATGNDGSSTSINYPAAYLSAVPVGSVNSKGDRSSFSNYQSTTHSRHLMAPGGDKSQAIVTEDVGKGGSTLCCGTSVATAYAAGMLALLWSDHRYAKLDRDQFLDEVIQKHCVRSKTQPQNEYGAGLIQYMRAAASDDDAAGGKEMADAEGS